MTRRARAAVVVLALALVLSGCAGGTRMATVGTLPNQHPLVTLVVSDDLGVVQHECRNVLAPGRIYGCQTSSPVVLDSGVPVKTVRIVRYADSLPSPIAFEIDAHELCHAIAALQPISDPCHVGNHGLLSVTPRGQAAAIRR